VGFFANFYRHFIIDLAHPNLDKIKQRINLKTNITRIYEYEQEKDVCRVIESIVRPGWICADVGAHLGLITALLAEIVGPEGHVIAFEAFPKNAEQLSHKMFARGLSSRVTVENMAITDGNQEKVWLFPGRWESSFEWNIVGHDVEGNPTEPKLQVRATSIDNYFPEGSRLDFIKIDIEGAAASALAGMRRLLCEIKPTLLIEFHDEIEWAARSELYSVGYELLDLNGRRLDPEKDTSRIYHCLAVHPDNWFFKLQDTYKTNDLSDQSKTQPELKTTSVFTKKFYCTYFDRNYLFKGLALIESLRKHEKNDYQLFVICLDELTRIILKKLNLPNVTLIPMHEIERRDFPLLETKKNRSTVEYYWTATPTILLRLLERNPYIDVLTYLDADLYFYSSPNPIFEELGNQSVLIHEHRFSPSLRHLEIHGKYNVGLLCFRNDANGIVVLNWWRERCIEWCYAHEENGKFADQMYLNDWTKRFNGVAVLQNIGAGVAPWNHEQYAFNADSSGNVLVNGKPLIFYHFHSFAFVSPDIIIPAKITVYPLTKEILRLCFLPYIYALNRGKNLVQSVIPDFMFGLGGENLTIDHTFFAKKELALQLKNVGIPHIPIQLDHDWDCYCSSQLKELTDIQTTIVEEIDNINHLIESGNFNEANTALNQAIEKYPDSPDLLNLQAALKFQMGDKEGTKIVLFDLINRWPAYFPAYNNLALIFWNSGDFDNAVKYFEDALRTSNFDRSVVFSYGDMLFSHKKYAKAKELYEGYLKRNPNDIEIRSHLQKVEGILEKVNKLNQAIDKAI
jgi:FkbM family methyltransferase